MMLSPLALDEPEEGFASPAAAAAKRRTGYKSKHPGTVDPRDFEMGVKVLRSRADFGVSHGLNAEDPARFLRSHAKEPQLPDPAKPERERPVRKAPVPARTDKPRMGLSSGTDYIRENALKTIQAHPPPARPALRYVDRPGFGKAPRYLQLTQRRLAAERAAQAEAARHEEAGELAGATPLPEEERAALLRNLKLKWQQVTQAFQRLPFSLDTPAQKKRKEALEAQLEALEADIRLLEAPGPILILPD